MILPQHPMMKQLTRAASTPAAVLQGIAPDGGLYTCDPGRSWTLTGRAALKLDTMCHGRRRSCRALLPDFSRYGRTLVRGQLRRKIRHR